MKIRHLIGKFALIFLAIILACPVFAKMTDVVTDQYGSIYVLNGHDIYKYNREGEYLLILNEMVSHSRVNLKKKEISKSSQKGKFTIGLLLNDNEIQNFAKYLKVSPELKEIAKKIFYPERITVGSGGLIYAIGQDNSYSRGVIGVIDPDDGRTIAVHRVMSTEEARKLYPRDIVVDKEGNIYITNFEDYPIKKFTKDGRFIMGIGRRGKGIGEFIWPWGVAVDKRTGDIYVTDVYAPRAKEIERSNLCVQKFDKNGKFLRRWGGELIKLNSLFPPNITFLGANTVEFAEGIAVDSRGYVYVLEKFGPRISKFDDHGRLIKRWGKRGNSPGEFKTPEGICVDKNDNVYIADTGNNRVQKFDSSGNFLMEIR